VASGERFAAGETMLLGGMMVKFEAAPDGRLRLTEPDMQSMPITFVDSMAKTMYLLRCQTDTVKSFGTDNPDFAPVHRPLLITGAALQGGPLRLVRRAGDAQLTGWAVSHADGETAGDATYRPMSVYEAMLKRPELSCFLALPKDYEVVTSGAGEFVVSKAGVALDPVEGSFLDYVRKAKAKQAAGGAPKK
jgi:hypothetical protein